MAPRQWTRRPDPDGEAVAGVRRILRGPSIFLVYTHQSIMQVFFITAATFGAMSLYGYTTQRDYGAILGPSRNTGCACYIGPTVGSLPNKRQVNGKEVVIQRGRDPPSRVML
jgi:hypothetical protein